MLTCNVGVTCGPTPLLKFIDAVKYVYTIEVLYYSGREQQRCWSDCADAQAKLRLCCSHMAWPGCLKAWLIWGYVSTERPLYLSRDMSKRTMWLCFQRKYPPSRIRVFAVRMKKPWVLDYPLNDAKSDLSLPWAHTHFVDFVMSRLTCPTVNTELLRCYK